MEALVAEFGVAVPLRRPGRHRGAAGRPRRLSGHLAESAEGRQEGHLHRRLYGIPGRGLPCQPAKPEGGGRRLGGLAYVKRKKSLYCPPPPACVARPWAFERPMGMPGVRLARTGIL